MKTLNEVIKSLEECMTDDAIESEGICLATDSLYYLKEYREHLKWQAYEEHCLAEEKKKIKQAYEQGYAQAKQDDAVARSWEESYRQSQMPWNHYTEMGG